MFIYLLFTLLPALSVAECIYPGHSDGSSLDFVNYLSYYETNSTLSARCLTIDGYRIAMQQCQENGSWQEESLRCINDVAAKLVWKSSNSTCSFYKTCKPATTWELSLEVVSNPDVEGFEIYTNNQVETADITVELVSITGATNRTTFNGVKDRAQGELRLGSVARVRVMSTIPISPKYFKIYSFSGTPVYSKSGGYYCTSNLFSRIVTGGWNTQETFTDAQKKCVSFGGRLLEAFDPMTLEYFHNDHMSKIWIGLSASNSSWKWQSGKLFDQKYFDKYPIAGNPSNGMAIAYDRQLNSLVPTDQGEKVYFACRLDSLPQGCMNPGTPAAGRILRTNDERTEYECFKGYKMVGEAVRRCNLASGYYLTEMPACVKEN